MNFLEPQETQAEEAAPINYIIETQGGLIARDPFDPTHLLKVFDGFHVAIDTMANKAMGVAVKSDEDLETATMLTNQAKGLTQAIEKERIRLKEPYLKITSVLDFETKQLKDRLVKVQGHINGLITPFLQKKEEARRAAERKAAEEAARIQRELDEKARLEREAAAKEAREKAGAEGLSKKQAEEAARNAAAMVEEAPVVVAEAPAEIKIQTDAGSAKIKEEIDFEVLNPMMLPEMAFVARREQVIAALKPWISAQIKSGVREIPGVRIFKIAKLQTRTAAHKGYEKF